MWRHQRAAEIGGVEHGTPRAESVRKSGGRSHTATRLTGRRRQRQHPGQGELRTSTIAYPTVGHHQPATPDDRTWVVDTAIRSRFAPIVAAATSSRRGPAIGQVGLADLSPAVTTMRFHPPSPRPRDRHADLDPQLHELRRASSPLKARSAPYPPPIARSPCPWPDAETLGGEIRRYEGSDLVERVPATEPLPDRIADCLVRPRATDRSLRSCGE